jgi:hypothetical protein
MLTTTESTSLPPPSKGHATCAWCGLACPTIVELIDHVDTGHLLAGDPAA